MFVENKTVKLNRAFHALKAGVIANRRQCHDPVISGEPDLHAGAWLEAVPAGEGAEGGENEAGLRRDKAAFCQSVATWAFQADCWMKMTSNRQAGSG